MHILSKITDKIILSTKSKKENKSTSKENKII